MKCILLVTTSETVRTFRQSLIRHLVARGDDVTVIAYDPDYKELTEQLGAKFYCVRQENRWLNPFAILRYTAQVRRILKKEKPDAVFTFQLKPNTFGVLAAKAAGVKQVLSMVEGGGDVFTYNTPRWKLIRLVTCVLYRWAFSHVSRVFFLNEEDKAEFLRRKLVREEKCRVIPGVGVDLAHFACKPMKNQRTFLMMARMLESKGVYDFCKCARLVRQKYPDAIFQYLGAEATVTVKDIAEYIDDGSVQYLGATQDVRPYLENCTCLLLPSGYGEGLPMSIMEAEATGRPVITTDNVGCRDTVRHGYNGFVLPVGDYRAMAEKCIYFIEHPQAAESMGAAARTFAESKFDEKTVNTYLLQEFQEREVQRMKKAMLMANDTTYVYNLRQELIEELSREGYKVSVVAERQNHQDKLQALGCELIDLIPGRHGTNPFADLMLFFKYMGILRREKPDVVLSYNIKPNVYGGFACRLLGIRYMPNVTGLGTPVEHPGLMQKLTTRLYKLGVSGAACVFFQNEENRQFFRDRKMLSKKSRTCLLPGSGVSPVTHPLRQYPMEGPVRFLFAARIMQEKGIDQFLAAARKFHSENVLFEICGMCDDPEYKDILAKAQDEGAVIYHGVQKDMNPFYERCSCFLYPSYYPEGMSNVLLEAAASGRPAIAADRSGCRETVDHGVTGYIVPVKDTEAVLEAVEKFLSLSREQRRQMGLAARAKVEKEFDRRLVVEAYINELNKG